MLTGGCACATIRFLLASAPYDAGWCHCRLCQRISGAPAMVFATVPRGDWAVTAGHDRIGRFRSSTFGERIFATCCGAPLAMQVDHQPGEIDVVAISLDAPEAIAPGYHIFVSEALPWAPIADSLPQFARFRPDTRGLPPERA